MGKRKKEKKNEWLDWLKALLIAFGLAFIVRMFFFAPIVVDGPSMLPTLHDGDQMIVNKFAYHLHEPERFDVVVFHASSKKDFIKRVIGLPGEHVEVIDNVLYINGEEVNEPFLTDQKDSLKSYQILTNDFSLEDLPGGYDVIPEDHVLVLGDNRGNSTDSRVLGVVSTDQIVGKTDLIYWPFNRMQTIGK
ncbi:MAG: signal peptidase I [Bacillota bacterium]|uniref:signal peptidase I n=1 Tax=unclassified Virgibacillus TaxID=2620237 RepID=UPI000428ECEE|nr:MULTISPECIES: signal peptidase I [Bacillaceae]MCC2249302.1 signal peptidase I [Virgibacillus sp. AGTR]MDY7043872.1 signal peptidase I [Virgibacillus sp. M23]QRZ17335.1 signal peptidase I [Virgibacillus sp. AGTR]